MKNIYLIGLLLVLGNNETMKISGIELSTAKDLMLKDFGTTGRLVAFTEKAIKDLEGRIYGNKDKEKETAKERKLKSYVPETLRA